jgi:hypothetical protein
MNIEIIEKKNINVTVTDDEILQTIDGFKYTKEDLTDDGVFKIETHLRYLSMRDDKQEEERLTKLTSDKRDERDLKMRVKCLALKKIGKPILFNTYLLKIKDRTNCEEIMRTYNNKTPEEIIKEFNETCCDELFEDPVAYITYPIYNT